MRRSKAEIYLHLVWGTWQRTPFITPDIERELYRCIESEARKLEVTVLAIGGVADHVHLLVRIPTKLCAANLAKQVKGVSSTFVRDQLSPAGHFRWQEGYGVFSISRSHVERVIAYINDQKRHHAQNSVWPEWEESDEETR